MRKYIHYTQTTNVPQIQAHGLRVGDDGLLFSFENSDEGYKCLYDMMAWRLFGSEETDYINNKIAAIPYSIVTFDTDETPEVDINLSQIFTKDIPPENITIIDSIPKELRDQIVLLIHKHEFTDEDLNMALEIMFRSRSEHQTSAEYLKEDADRLWMIESLKQCLSIISEFI